MKLSKNFSVDEFDSKDGSKMPIEVLENIQELAKTLQVIRKYIKKPITINSGYRSPHYNNVVLPSRGIKTSKNSQHVLGKAADIVIQDYTPEQVADFIEGLINYGVIKDGGLGRYKTFTHFDIREKRARW